MKQNHTTLAAEIAATRANAARDFPANTCGASRHTQDIAEAMLRGRWLPDAEDLPHSVESILATVAALYKARTKIARLRLALITAEAALADIGDAERQPTDDLAWCEARAAAALPSVRAALRAA